MDVNNWQIYSEFVLKEIQKELPECVNIDVDEDGYAILVMNDGKTMMQQEFHHGKIKTLILQWNVNYLLETISSPPQTPD